MQGADARRAGARPPHRRSRRTHTRGKGRGPSSSTLRAEVPNKIHQRAIAACEQGNTSVPRAVD
eukprot:12881933-Prorocentrum_lima.AAC.1